MQRSLCTLILFVALTFVGCEAGDEFGIAGGPADLLTRAERSDYLETSRHAEVIEFLPTGWLLIY